MAAHKSMYVDIQCSRGGSDAVIIVHLGAVPATDMCVYDHLMDVDYGGEESVHVQDCIARHRKRYPFK